MNKGQSLRGKIFQKLLNATAITLYRPKVIWKDKALKKALKNKPVIFVSNHLGHIDGAFMGAVLGRYKPYMLVAKDWYDKKGVGSLIKLCRTIPIDRFGADAVWYEESLGHLKNGSPVIIFPEGFTSKDGVVKEFKPGAALLSAVTGAPIVPLAIYGDYKPIFGMRQKVMIGNVIESSCPEDMRHSLYAKQLIKKAEEEVKALRRELEETYGGSTPAPSEEKEEALIGT